ncbi:MULTISPECIES: hypothetical protein [unclassified Streptomyces]|uniref:hypothetical protein n=1 Tax=unclassified Streptomyces TaxID=2593676 RepID=UPI0036F8B804
MPGRTGDHAEGAGAGATALGRSFAAALSEGLSRSVASRAYALPGRPAAGPALPDPYADAVLRRFVEALPAVAAGDGRYGSGARAASVRRARELLRGAFGLAAPGGHPGPSAPEGTAAPDGAPAAGDEAAVVTLLLECAVRAVLEEGPFEGSARRPPELVRALGRRLREVSREPVRGG